MLTNLLRTTILKRVAGAGMFVALVATLAIAQTAQIEGTVKVKAADGSLKPVEGALIDIHRVDIKGHWEVKTDKKGRYIRLGMPVQGTFLVVATGPGMEPTWLTGVRLLSGAPIDFIANPGDGTKLTPEQVQSLLSNKPPTGGAPGQPGVSSTPSSGDRAKADAQQKELDAKRKEGQELQAGYDAARTRYNQGIEFMKTNNYQGALSEFEAAAGIDASKHEAFTELAYKANANVAETRYQIGVELFNQKKRDEAKVHFVKAVEHAEKAIAQLATIPPEKNPNINNEMITYYSIRSKNAMLLIEHFGAVDQVDPTIQSIAKVSALDTMNKNKWAVMRGDVFRFAGRSEDAVTAYKEAITTDPNNVDALYGLGLTLIAAQEKERIQEGANALADFVAKAQPTDKRVPDVKAALEAVKEAYKVEAEKPSTRRRGRP
jgi:tetratricopeptide (TPR) repeat protein